MKRPKPNSAPRTSRPKFRPKNHRQDRDDVVLRRLGMRLDAYLRDRARVEGFGYELTPDFFIRAYRGGVRMMYGIGICDHGEMLHDDQEPHPGYFETWLQQGGYAKCAAKHPPPPRLTRDQLSEYWRAAADNFTDEALLAKWDMVGKRMARELPEEFATTLAQFTPVSTPDTSPTSIELWQRFGRVLIEKDRRTLAELAICNHIFLDGQKKRAAAASLSETP